MFAKMAAILSRGEDELRDPECFKNQSHFKMVPELAHVYPDKKVHGANMGPTWVLSAPDGPHVGPMNLAIRVCLQMI